MIIAFSEHGIGREVDDVFDDVIIAIEEHHNKHWKPSEGQAQPMDSQNNSFNNHVSQNDLEKRQPTILSN